jgi:branched-chain amino acid transport system ATP-binding protein
MRLLEISDLHAGYGQAQVLHGLHLSVDAGEAVALLGANGAGKTTALRAISGLIPSRGGLTFSGTSISGMSPDALVRLGISHVPQGRGTLAALSVDDNLRAGAITRRDRDVAADIRRTYENFPQLAQRRGQAAGKLSGGEQQMLAIGRALLARPRLLLLDEPSLGLAPGIVRDLMDRLALLTAQAGTALLLAEQNAAVALKLATRAYVLDAGRIAFASTGTQLAENPALRHAYLGR